MIPSNPEQRTKLLAQIQDAMNQQIIIKSAKDIIGDIRKNVKEELQMEAKEFNYYVKSFEDDTYPEESFSELEDLYHSYEILKGIK